MAVGAPFGPEQFRQAAEDRPLSFGVFRQWIVNRFGEVAAESITPDNFRDHNLYVFFKASTTPLVSAPSAGAPTQFPDDPFATPPILEPGPLAAIEGIVTGDADVPPTPDTGDDDGAPGIPPFPTDPPPQGFQWVFDRNFLQWVPQRTPTAPPQPPQPGESEAQRAQREQQQQQFDITQQRLIGESEADRLFREQNLAFQREQLAATQAFQQQQLTGQREERLAQLATQPISWLQHAALSGQTPVVQQWMIPLMRPGQNLQVGQPLPGFQPGAPGGAQQGGFIPGTATPSPLGTQFANLPELRRPSAQLFARMGPTAQQQFLGFRQARTGIPPQETLFRQRQSGPPGAGRGGFQQQRLRV